MRRGRSTRRRYVDLRDQCQRNLLMDPSTSGDNGWVELRHLEYFLAVADNRSFTQAARKLHVVQSGVSATIKALERELGAELFARGPAGVTLTPAGQALRPRARATLDAARAAKDAVNATLGSVRGTVTVGILTSVSVIDLPTLLADLHARHPEVVVHLRAASAGSAGLARQLRDGDLDIAFLVFTGPRRPTCTPGSSPPSRCSWLSPPITHSPNGIRCDWPSWPECRSSTARPDTAPEP